MHNVPQVLYSVNVAFIGDSCRVGAHARSDFQEADYILMFCYINLCD